MIPLLRKTIIEPAWVGWSGSSLLRYWRHLEKTQYLSEDRIKAIQLSNLRNILIYAYQNNAYYRKLFNDSDVDLQEMKLPEDISKVPILTKKDIRKNSDLLISEGFSRKNLIEAKTGGSTGIALQIYYTEEYSELKNACVRRHDRWSGWEVGEAKAYVWGNPPRFSAFRDRLKTYLLSPIIFLDTMEITKKSVNQFVRQWKKTKPTLLFGHAHSLYVLAKSMIEFSVDDIRPKAIISSSMSLLLNERNLIERVFGSKVFDRYGCEEVGLIASECEMHEGLHLNADNLYVEILNEDSNCAADGQYGRIIVTDFLNKAMPFIRYQIEDMAVACSDKCKCGRGLPLMREVSGRVADFLIKKNGGKVAGISLIENTLTKYEGIEQMQIIQHDLGTMTLNIVRGDDFKDDMINPMIEHIRAIFELNLNINCNFVSTINPEPSGKYRFSKCYIKQD